MEQPLVSLKKNITTCDYPISPLAFPTKWLKSPNPAALMACTWRGHSTRLKTAITDLPLQKRPFNKPASKLYIVSPGYEEGMKPAADFNITHGFIVFDTKQKVKLTKKMPQIPQKKLNPIFIASFPKNWRQKILWQKESHLTGQRGPQRLQSWKSLDNHSPIQQTSFRSWINVWPFFTTMSSWIFGT